MSTPNGVNIITKGLKPIRYLSIDKNDSRLRDGEIVEEGLVCISVNGQELATLMCTPRDLDKMALGFLYNEALITSMDDVRHVHISQQKSCVEVWLHDVDITLPQQAIITAGCGGGVTFDDLSQTYPPLSGTTQATPTQLAYLMRQMHLGATLYQRARGIHTAALADPEQILLQVEDVGRHNCLDKLCGAALINGLATQDKILLSSGRISSEMINKARRLETPIVCSRTSPTSLSVALAKAWHITIVAYLRQNRMRIYTHPERVVINEANS